MKYMTFLLLVALPGLQAMGQVVQDDLTDKKIDKKIWKVSQGGTVGVDEQGVYICSGPGEEAAQLILKKKVNPDDYFELRAEIFPRKDESDGYAVFVSGTGWSLQCGDDGRFWVVAGGKTLQPTGSNPMDAWYKIEVDNRPGAACILVKDSNDKTIGKWIFTKGPGLSSRIVFGAVTGGSRKGPRGMRVQNVHLNILPEPALKKIPAEIAANSSSRKVWRVVGKGSLKVENKTKDDNCIFAKLSKSSQVIYTFPKTFNLSNICAIEFSIRVSTTDDAYDIQYALISENGGILYCNDLNQKEEMDWTNRILYSDLMGEYNYPNTKRIVAFSISFNHLEKPAKVWLKELNCLLPKEKVK